MVHIVSGCSRGASGSRSPGAMSKTNKCLYLSFFPRGVGPLSAIPAALRERRNTQLLESAQDGFAMGFDNLWQYFHKLQGNVCVQWTVPHPARPNNQFMQVFAHSFLNDQLIFLNAAIFQPRGCKLSWAKYKLLSTPAVFRHSRDSSSFVAFLSARGSLLVVCVSRC